MKKIEIVKGQKVWCSARVHLFLPNIECMCGTIKYKLPKLINLIVSMFLANNTKTAFYCIEMADGKSKFYPSESIYEINRAIYIAENLWGVNEECTDPKQMSAHLMLVFWYEDMKRYSKSKAAI